MNQDQKLLHFEYVVKGLLRWYTEITGNQAQNDLSTLKALKLLFFVSAARSRSNAPNPLLDDVFNEYVAMPYGHVESEIYSQLVQRGGQLKYYIIDNRKTVLRPDVNIEELDNEVMGAYKTEIDSSIEFLKKINPGLILLPPFSLVDLSHTWYSWKKYYTLARAEANNSKSIPTEEIKKEDKIFNLQPF